MSEDYLAGLTDEEKQVFIVFDTASTPGATPKEAREKIRERLHVSPPHRTTVTPIFKVATEFLKTEPSVLTAEEAEEIAVKVGYGTPASRVVDLHRLYRLWRHRKRQDKGEPSDWTQQLEIPPPEFIHIDDLGGPGIHETDLQAREFLIAVANSMYPLRVTWRERLLTFECMSSAKVGQNGP